MDTATIKALKDELKHQNANQLLELCLKLARFKKENKELLTYLLFESDDEERYILGIKNEIDVLFENINTKSYFFIRKSARKILTTTKKYIRFSKKKETEVELLIYYCIKLKNFTPSIKNSPRLQSILTTQVKLIEKIVATLHEDLQYDYRLALDPLSS
ncbi:hypothetical protein [Tenacibaculum finnmarkense]|uniref:hypothetical protein n=1 Tax=Tenacibaculum finnmarkense TaxID=2781243 RepID=UPI000C3B15E4|nr:hypothetical protein [Tenacibaculum finnmarkense]MCD8439594.1 hypothetical protein [Tenacibaculum finnmarkense genomovar ulcerans]MCG8720443.1 hypothetical protein [Tenacibaculum finnmarkense]SOS56069.1 conserved hypothetical protein [Tenacibaculum finnmarkense]